MAQVVSIQFLELLAYFLCELVRKMVNAMFQLGINFAVSRSVGSVNQGCFPVHYSSFSCCSTCSLVACQITYASSSPTPKEMSGHYTRGFQDL